MGDSIDLLRSELNLLIELSNNAQIDLEMENLINQILKIIKKRTQFEGVNLTVADEKEKIMRTYMLDKSLYDNPERWEMMKIYFRREFPLESDLWICRCYLNNEEFFYPDIKNCLDQFSKREKKALKRLGYSGCYFLPLRLGERNLGTFVIYNLKSPFFLSDYDKEAVQRLSHLISKVIENSILYHEIKEKNKVIEQWNLNLRKELELAQTIQQNLIPDTPQLEGVDFAALYKPMEQIGGDFYDFLHFREQNIIGIFISDISGHGIPAALITIMLKVFLETSRQYRLSSKFLLNYINTMLKGQTGGSFLTAFYGIYNIDNQTLMYGRAAHPYPILVRDGELIELKSRGKILGVLNDIEIEEKGIHLKKNDKIIFYTDGLTEALSPRGSEFEGQFNTILKKHYELPIKKLIERIYYYLLLHCEKDVFDDDICIVGMEVK